MKYKLKSMWKMKHSNEPFSNLLLDIIINPFLWVIANFTSLTPNFITSIGLILGIISTYFFILGNVIMGGIFYLLRQSMDGIDGRLSRLKNISTYWGAWYENYTGIITLFICSGGLCIGQYLITSKMIWLILWPLIIQSFRMHNWASMKMAILLGDKFKKKVVISKSKTLVGKIRNWLNKHHLNEPFSSGDGVFLIFIVGPLTGYIIETIILWLVVILLKEIFWVFYYKKILDGLKKVPKNKQKR